MLKPVPSMSTAGWVTDPSTKLDNLLAYYFVNLHNQDTLHPDTIASISFELVKQSYKPENAVSGIESSLREYLTKYFSSVTVSVTSNAEAIDGTQSTLYIVVEFTDGTYISSNSYAYDAKTSNFSKVTNILNQ